MKRKTLTTALLAGLTGTVGIAATSNAVNINPDGLGEALVYPYYTTRDGQDTLISVVNTTDQVKAVKVRFLEAMNSREVLDFNLFLSPFDVWTAAVIDIGTGAGIFTEDISCTLPQVPGTVDTAQPFRNFRFSGGFADGGPTGLDRTREGYLEILEMGSLDPAGAGAPAVHGAGMDCPSLLGVTDADAAAPSGGLFGGTSFVNVGEGRLVSHNAIAIDDWRVTSFITGPGDETPRLSNANAPGAVPGTVRSRVFFEGDVVESSWLEGAQAVSAVFMHNNIMNEFVLDEGTESGTDWVVNFPTKRFHTDTVFAVDTPPVPPFTTVFQADPAGRACEAVNLNIWDREENTPTTGIDFSPLPPEGANVLCFEANVVTFNESSVLSSALDTFSNINTTFENGWARIAFDDPANSMTSEDGDTYFGLPVTGFMIQTFTNRVLEVDGVDVLSNYAGLFNHRATRLISAAD